MMNANIVNNPAVRMILLESGEKSGLRRKITGHGKLKAAVQATGLSEGTIKRAAFGEFKVKEDTANKIRTFLYGPSEVSEVNEDGTETPLFFSPEQLAIPKSPCTSPSSAVSNQ